MPNKGIFGKKHRWKGIGSQRVGQEKREEEPVTVRGRKREGERYTENPNQISTPLKMSKQNKANYVYIY